MIIYGPKSTRSPIGDTPLRQKFSTLADVSFSFVGNLLSKTFGKIGLRPNTDCDRLNPLFFIIVFFGLSDVVKFNIKLFTQFYK